MPVLNHDINAGTLIDLLELPMLLIDPDLVVLAANQAYCDLMSIDVSDLAGARLDDALPSLSGSTLIDALSDALTSERKQALEGTLSNSFLETTIHPAPWGLLVVFENATRKQEFDRLRWNLIDGMAHAFQTPLTSITGYSETLLKSDNVDDATRLDFLEGIHEQSQRLSGIVNNLLFLSRIEAGSQSLEKSVVDLRDPVRDAVSELIPAAKLKLQELTISSAQQPLPVKGDINALYELVFNLLDNAIKYTPDYGEIKLGLGLEHGYVVLTVSDTGSGISPEEQSRIYERFFRGGTARKSDNPGAGLGLALVRQVVDRHGGTIEVSSETDIGTTFTVRFCATY